MKAKTYGVMGMLLCLRAPSTVPGVCEAGGFFVSPFC